jgi:hypothetical protein
VNDVHPIFKRALAGMIEPQEFDETDADLIHDVCEGPTLGDPVYSLLNTLRDIKRTAGSFGVDKSKAYDELLPKLEALRAACKSKWEDSQ